MATIPLMVNKVSIFQIEVSTGILFQVLLCRVRYKFSYRDVAEFFIIRGFVFTHETVRGWEERFPPLFAKQITAKRKGKVGKVSNCKLKNLRG